MAVRQNSDMFTDGAPEKYDERLVISGLTCQI